MQRNIVSEVSGNDAISSVALEHKQRIAMSSTQPGPRPQGPSGRGPPSGSSAGPSVRPPPITVNGGSQLPGETMSRAEKFEDEKRRIIESCFGKKEPDGSGTASKQFKEFGLRLTVIFNSVGILHNAHTDP